MLTLYIFTLKGSKHVATIKGSSCIACEAVANEYYHYENHKWAYTPAFGSAFVYNPDAELIEA